MSSADFYDLMEPFYHLIYPDWERSMARQAKALDAVIRQEWPAGVKTILDATCGIGTQAIGLAKLGYAVTGSDLSAKAVARAKREAAARNLAIPCSCCDVRELAKHHAAKFDLVISCDNSLPHLLSDEDLSLALAQMFACTNPGGGCLVTVRDYAKEKAEGVEVKPYGVRDADGKRYVALQVWEWHGATYDVVMYFIEDESGDECRTHVMRSTYRPVTTERLLELMGEAGFTKTRRVDGDFYQPVLVGTRPNQASRGARA